MSGAAFQNCCRCAIIVAMSLCQALRCISCLNLVAVVLVFGRQVRAEAITGCAMISTDTDVTDELVTKVALGCAARFGHVGALEHWLSISSGSNVNEQAESGWYAIHEAAMAGHVETVTMLFRFGASANVRENDGRAPLHWAVLGGHLQTAELLLRHGADPNGRDATLATPLHGVAVHGQLEMAELLVEMRADVTASDGWQQTPLYATIVEGQFSLVEFMLAQGADILAPDVEGRTPLQTAVSMAQVGRSNSGHVLEFLLAAAGVNV